MKEQELPRLFYLEVEKVIQDESMDTPSKVDRLYHILNLLFVEATRKEQLQFTTLFARIAYATQKYTIEKQLRFYIHYFRKNARHLAEHDPEEIYNLGLMVVAKSISGIFDVEIAKSIKYLIPSSGFDHLRPEEISGFKSRIQVLLTGEDKEAQQLIGNDEFNPSAAIRIQYNIPDRNENFNPTIEALREHFVFPVVANLVDVEIGKDGTYRPAALVIEPNYLMDVSAIAECFKDYGAEPLSFLIKKFLPFTYSKHLMIGNIANFFLDELMTNPEVSFKEIFPKVFRLNPLAFVLFEDSVVREIMQTSQKHFLNLKNMVLYEFKKNGIDPKKTLLEPSFYSEFYGLQGRLDIFYKNDQSAIVELKSGKPFRPNVYGLNHNHYTQTLLYDLIIRSVFGSKIDPKNYILYSGVDERHLRFAPRVKAQQYEALQLRNQLITLEQRLKNLKKVNAPVVFEQIKTAYFPQAKGFAANDIMLFEKMYSRLNKLEKQYFHAFSAFISREQQLAKTGIQGIDKINGQAALWLDEFSEKEAGYNVISYLKVKENQTHADDPILTFHKTEQTSQLANFRNGDIAVLYAFGDKKQTVLTNQIFKGTIVDISETEVKIRLASKQFNADIFEQDTFWNMEHDLMDSSFTAMYRSLFQFMEFTDSKKELLFALKAPMEPEENKIERVKEFTEEQQRIFEKMVNAREYFLLWGPPGTGKTSIMLKNFVAHIINETDENVLLLAYTNRAVDEICEAIESIDAYITNDYFRIGSKYSTHPQYHGQLLNEKISKINTRSELKNIIESHRIVVATVSSFNSKMDLLKLKQFDRVIIDEASQILEPVLIGMLPLFRRFILIGDHNQLPAVVVQGHEESAVDSPELKAIGLSNLRNSLFERLYNQCRANNWDWAYDQLSHQGRMHETIMAFPNIHFYNGNLKTLPEPLSAKQLVALDYTLSPEADDFEKTLSENRVVFLPTSSDNNLTSTKTNAEEAQVIARLVKAFQRLYTASGIPFTAKSIGVITPYRAQIAMIQQTIIEAGIDPKPLTIDTVERYQGGAREIILISLCLNNPTQLSSLVSLSADGVDRKLNVALTRARNHLVIIGNPEILKLNGAYGELVEFCSSPVARK
ncbi:MAG: DNA replication ATP-dependent helicase Dna2 [Saprospiraceae bacterium]|jgi:DNA replication ATP-dependent helicase Dna2